MGEKFWWDNWHNSTSKISSIDSGVLNYRGSVRTESIFSTENFKNITSMLGDTELKIAAYKASGKSNSEIASKMGMDVKEVSEKVMFMTNMYRNIFDLEETRPKYRTINSKQGR